MIFGVEPGLYCDPAMRDGDVERSTNDGLMDLLMTHDTYLAVACTTGALRLLTQHLEHLPDGVYRLPGSITNPDRAEDTRRALEYLDPPSDAGDGCVMPNCWQDFFSDARGFRLCRDHHDDMADWDSLVA